MVRIWFRTRAVVCVLLSLAGVSRAQVATTTISDTIFHADGTSASGLVLVSWPAFTTAAGQAVAGGSTSATIGATGLVSLQLAPNVGATPAGTYYTAVFHLDDGSLSRETWAVPASSTPVRLAAVRATVLPASVAVQTASKSYVNDAVAAALAGQPITGSVTFLERTGDAMIGPLTLAGDPTTSSQAANKHYVDTAVGTVSSGLSDKVALAPQASQVVAQPTGTQMEINRLNGESFADQYVSGRGNNGIANATGGADCAGGCQVRVEQNYSSTEPANPLQWNDGTHVVDLRGGGRHDSYMNPVNTFLVGFNAGQVIDVASTASAANILATSGSGQPTSTALALSHEGVSGGSNLYPASIEGSRVPYFKSNYNAFSVTGTYNTMGQHVLAPQTIHCYGVGDCLIGAQFITASGGFRDEADEGTHPMDLQIQEDTAVFTGTCSSGCTVGSTAVRVAVTGGPGTQGEGRYLIDTNPAKTITSGVLTGGARSSPGQPGPTANFIGSNFPVSLFLETAQPAFSQAGNVAPGTVTLQIATSGLPAPYSTSTTALPTTSGLACMTDPFAPFSPPNYEMVPYNVVDATHVQVTLNKVHASGSTIAVGGLCGYGIEQTVDTAGGIRQVFPVIGSSNSSSLFYAGNLTPVLGAMNVTSGYTNVNLPIASVARTNGVVTVTTGVPLPQDVNGLTMTVSGVADATFNGRFAMQTTGPNTITFMDGGSSASSSGGTISVLTGQYVLYPMAEVLGVYDTQARSINGQLTLAPNTVAWAAGDGVEEPHYFQENVSGDTEYIGETTPRPVTPDRAGLQYQTNVGPGMRGWSVVNSTPVTNYFGNGGTHGAPDEAFEVGGVWNFTMEAQAGETSVFRLHCNSHGCGRWNSGYNLFEMDSNAGEDVVNYQPQTSGLTFNLRGASYGFTPQGFTAGSVTATTLRGDLDAQYVSSGTLAAARLPIFGGSGGAHGVGAVPDPGSTAGSSRFLREDGTWSTPPSGSGGAATGAATINGGTIQNAVISGGSLDGASIGQSTPAAGQFSQLQVTGCSWFLHGTDQGIGTCTPQNWNGVTGIDGSNLQIYGAGSSRLIVTSGGASSAMAEIHFVNVAAPSGSRNWRMSNDVSGRYTLDMNADDYSSHTAAMQCLPDGSCTFPNGLTASNFNGILAGTTATIGGTQLAAGGCTSGSVAVPGATVGAPVAVSASDGSLPSGLTMLRAAVNTAGAVAVQVCAVSATTPAALRYNVRVLK